MKLGGTHVPPNTQVYNMRAYLFLTALILACSSTGATEVTTDVLVSSNTLEWPEIHFLLRNNSSSEKEFWIKLGLLKCGEGDSAVKHTLVDDQFWLDTQLTELTGGTIASQSWNHRTFRIGVDSDVRALLPCTIEAKVSTQVEQGFETQRFEIDVPKGLVSRESGEADYRVISVPLIPDVTEKPLFEHDRRHVRP